MKQRAAAFVTVLAGLALAASGAAVGPWPGLAPSVTATTGASYSAKTFANTTRLRAVSGGTTRTVTLRGLFGIPAVTVNGQAGGLSRDGKTLLLTEPLNGLSLRAKSHFLLIATGTLKVRRVIVIKGSFGFDGLSPDNRTLYLIQQQSATNPKYAVRAYDLVRQRLLPQVIVDKREPDEKMNGYPVARTESQSGSWVYTLYRKQNDQTFIHALNTTGRYALCIDFHWPSANDNIWQATLALDETRHVLTIKTPSGAVAARVDTQSYNVIP
jgi:hypothetical protein